MTVKGIVSTSELALGKWFGRGAISYPSKDDVDNDPRCYLAEEVKQIIDAAAGQYKVLFKLAVRDRDQTSPHLRPDFMQDELARVPDFAFEFGSKIAVIHPFDPKLQAVA